MAITGPVALFNNLPIEPQFFQPWRFVISNITLGVTTTVTMIIPSITTLNYVIGQQIRLIIPPTFGCRTLNQQTGYVLSVINPNQVVVDINSVGANPFIPSVGPPSATLPQILAIGDISSGPTNTGRSNQATYIPGAFINISPN